MVSKDYFIMAKHELKHDAKRFLNGVIFSLLNSLKAKGIDTKEVELCGTNDIYILRGTNVIIFVFSRSCMALKPVYSEYTLAEIMSDESKLVSAEPILFESQVLSEFLRKEQNCTTVVSVSFPISYLSLKDDELKKSTRTGCRASR